MQQQISSCLLVMPDSSSSQRAIVVSLAAGDATLWLLQAPPGIHSRVWSVACAEAMEAMNWGRRYLRALSRGCKGVEELLDHSQMLITAFFPAIGPDSVPPVTEEDQQVSLVLRASHRAVAAWRSSECRFLQQDFVEQRHAP